MNYEYMKNAQKIQEYVTNMRPAFNKRAVFSDAGAGRRCECQNPH